MEIIELRTTDLNKKRLKNQLLTLMQDVKKENKNINISIFYRFKIDTDFRIYLKQNTPKTDIASSRIGQSLAAELKKYGLVNYSIWIEMKQDITKC